MPQSEALVLERVRSLAESVLDRHGAELVDLEVKKGRTQLVRLTVDRPDGIDLEACARISDELSRLLDADDPIIGRYTLEVSSPGADRPMKRASDFRRNVGRKVRVITAEGDVEGTLVAVEDERVRLQADDGGDEWVDLSRVVKGKVVLPW